MSKSTANLENYRDKTVEELQAALADTRDELFRLHLGQYTNQVTSTAALTTKRRDIARILTILRARTIGVETQAQKRTGKKAAKAAAAKKAKS